jgi:hypothetical protein
MQLHLRILSPTKQHPVFKSNNETLKGTLMNALTKFALVITSIALPLSANAALNSDIQETTTFTKTEVVKLVDIEMKLSASELIDSLKIEQQIVIAPASRLFVLTSAPYNNTSAPRIIVNKP